MALRELPDLHPRALGLEQFAGKRVGVVGTGSSGVQSIPEIARQARELTVFQRTPQFSIPARNRRLPPEEQAAIKADYRSLRARNRLTAAVAPALETVANALADMARGTGPVGGALAALFGQLDRLASYAVTFAALMAGRWVVGLAAAALSVRALATALVILRVTNVSPRSGLSWLNRMPLLACRPYDSR